MKKVLIGILLLILATALSLCVWDSFIDYRINHNTITFMDRFDNDESNP
jgi:hypothetical protein